MKKIRANNTVNRTKVWHLTWSPKDDTSGVLPDLIKEWLDKHSRKRYMVEENAKKAHIHCVFITASSRQRSWGCQNAGRLCTKLKAKRAALKISPHNNLAGAIGYLDGRLIENEGFDEKAIKSAVKIHKRRLEGKYYRDHVNAHIKLDPAAVTAMRELTMHKDKCDPEEAERLMAARGHIWAGMKYPEPFIHECNVRDLLAK